MSSRLKEVVKLKRQETNDWLRGISDYRQFIKNRRVDSRFRIIPDGWWVHLVILITLLITILSAFYLDPLYLEWYEYKHAERSRLFSPLTILGDSKWALLVCGTVLLIFSFFHSKRFQGARYVAWHRAILSLYFIFTNVLISGFIAVALKNIIGKARPQFAMYLPDIDLWTFRPFADKYDFASFPSGHATTAGAMMAACLLLSPRWGWIMFLLGLWVAISRTAIGVHYPSDVFAGVMLGVIVTWFYARSFARKRLVFCFDDKGKLCLRGN